MLDQIISIVKDQALKTVTNNSEIAADKKDAVAETTASAFMDGVKNQIAPDKLSGVLGMLGGSGSNSNTSSITDSMSSGIQSNIVSALSQKLGLSSTVATTIASTVVPAVMGMISKKHDDPNDSFNLGSLVQSVTGKGDGGLLSSLGGLLGKK